MSAAAVQAPSPPVAAPTPQVPGLPDELARLFRHALREGRVHPLMPMLLRYRQAAAREASA